MSSISPAALASILPDEGIALTVAGEATPLYRRVLGDAWLKLAGPVRIFHTTGATLRGAGTFNVRRGESMLARALAGLLRLPASGEGRATRLVVTSLPEGEHWHRTFDGHSFVTEQHEHREQQQQHLLAEHVGMMEILYRLDVKDGSLFYQQTRAALRIGHRRVALPRRFAPRINACERPVVADRPRVHVSVRVDAPLAGLLVAYEGEIELEETT
ncbi:MAG: DUF4166 domain-containing protein [Pyrinomonadaceae bacterium]